MRSSDGEPGAELRQRNERSGNFVPNGGSLHFKHEAQIGHCRVDVLQVSAHVSMKSLEANGSTQCKTLLFFFSSLSRFYMKCRNFCSETKGAMLMVVCARQVHKEGNCFSLQKSFFCAVYYQSEVGNNSGCICVYDQP
jgi:hypothetical protein